MFHSVPCTLQVNDRRVTNKKIYYLNKSIIIQHWWLSCPKVMWNHSVETICNVSNDFSAGLVPTCSLVNCCRSFAQRAVGPKNLISANFSQRHLLQVQFELEHGLLHPFNIKDQTNQFLNWEWKSRFRCTRSEFQVFLL